MNTKMNVFHDKHKLLIWIPEADIEINVFFQTTFADPDPKRTWVGTHIYYRSGEQMTEFATTDIDHFIAHYDHIAARIVRAVFIAELAARQTGVPQSVSYRPGPTPTVVYGPALVRLPGEPWVEIAPDGIAVWHNEEEA